MEWLRRIGPLIYGPTWQTGVSKALDVSTRTVLRWLAGEYPIPDGVIDELRQIAKQRQAEIGDALKA